MMKLKKITAVLLSVITLVCMVSVPAGAQSYKYKVASVPVSDVIGKGQILSKYRCADMPFPCLGIGYGLVRISDTNDIDFSRFISQDLYFSINDNRELYNGDVF